MQNLIQLFIWLPLLGFLLIVIMSRKNENAISGIAISMMAIHLMAILVFIVSWIWSGSVILDIKHVTLFKTEDIEIFIDFYFDAISAVFAIIGSFLALLVLVFSRFYLHRDEGFKRYFNTIMLFLLGYNMVVFSGNFETLFVGWELIGICSFLLISFYRNRYLPVKNAFKVISIYRMSDICLILAMWMSHHLWHENITFLELTDKELVQGHIVEHGWYVFFISSMIIFAAAIKSAQFPFSTWLPRAMEGPTTSSAVFYGSLSVHIGVFLLLRTYPYWESLLLAKLLIIGIGFFSALIANSIARVQSSVKTQIAYASIVQISIIFIEVALGWHTLALIHFAGNAILRTYQLLVSPSVLHYMLHDMIYSFMPNKKLAGSGTMFKLKNAIFIFSLKEWDMDFYHKIFFWNPYKLIGDKLGFLTSKSAALVLAIIYIVGLYANFFQKEIPVLIFDILPHSYSLIGLLLILRSFAERGDALWAWSYVIFGQLFIILSVVLLNENFGQYQILLYLCISVLAAITGYICLIIIRKRDQDINLNKYHGYVYEAPRIGLVFLIACLAFAGLPFTPTFIGIDLLFSHIHKHEELLIIFVAISFVFVELSILRIYTRVFLGQHKKQYHAIAYKSS